MSFVAPHFPLTAPPHWYYRYWQQDLPMPKQYRQGERPHHHFLEEYANTVDYDAHFHSDADVKRALAGYAGLVSSLDENIGHVLHALHAAGLAETTQVIYTSDHGDNQGARGLWGKSTFYEESAGVPAIIAGPGIPAGRVVDTPISHIDFAPTIVAAAGERVDTALFPGASLVDIAQGAHPTRPVLSEYHAIGSTGGGFMLRFGRFKYCRYAKHPAQLFDLVADPEELVDLAADPAHAADLAEAERRLRAVLDPAAVDARAKARQQSVLEALGGREAALARGDLGFSPAPGTPALIDR